MFLTWMNTWKRKRPVKSEHQLEQDIQALKDKMKRLKCEIERDSLRLPLRKK